MTTEQLDLMTGEEVAQLLRVSYRHVTATAQRGDLPGVKIGRIWRFNRPDVLAWLREKSSKG